MLQSKETQQQVRNKVLGKGYKAISKALGLRQTTVRVSEGEKESSEPSHEWTPYKMHPKSAATTHPRCHKGTQHNRKRTAGLTCLSYDWEKSTSMNSKVKATAYQKHKGC